MTRAQLSVIASRLAEGLPLFATHRSLLFVRPIGHTLRAVLLDRSSDPRGFYSTVFMQPMFVPADHLILNCGWRFGGGAHCWKADAPGVEDELRLEIARQAVPFLEPIRSPRDVAIAARAMGLSLDPVVVRFVAYAFARAGDVVEAQLSFDQLLSLLAGDTRPYVRKEFDDAVAFRKMLLTDSSEAVALLKSFERRTLESLRLVAFR